MKMEARKFHKQIDINKYHVNINKLYAMQVKFLKFYSFVYAMQLSAV